MAEDGDITRIEFWGEEVPPGGAPYSVEVENEPPVYHMVHITGCALGDAPKAGPHVLKAVSRGKAIALATLERGPGGAAQAPLDFGFSGSTTFINAGPSPVFLSGYVTRSVQLFEGSDDDDDDEDEDEDEDEEHEVGLEDSDVDDDAAPRAALANGRRRKAQFVDDEAEDEDEDMDDEDEDDEDEDDDSDGGLRPTTSSGDGDEDDDDEDDEDESGGGDDSDSDSDGPPSEKKSAPPPKRAAAAAALATPQPAKKPKAADGAPRAPASAPPKVQQQPQQPSPSPPPQQAADAAKQYLKAVVSFLKSEDHPVQLSVLGTKVKRPPSVKSAKAFVLSHAEKLVFDEQAQTVALKTKP